MLQKPPPAGRHHGARARDAPEMSAPLLLPEERQRAGGRTAALSIIVSAFFCAFFSVPRASPNDVKKRNTRSTVEAAVAAAAAARSWLPMLSKGLKCVPAIRVYLLR